MTRELLNTLQNMLDLEVAPIVADHVNDNSIDPEAVDALLADIETPKTPIAEAELIDYAVIDELLQDFVLPDDL